MSACTSQSAGTSVRRKGIEFLSTGADILDTLHPCRRCSTCVRTDRTKGLPFEATSRIAGSVSVDRTARGLAQPRDPARWWEYRSLDSYSSLVDYLPGILAGYIAIGFSPSLS